MGQPFCLAEHRGSIVELSDLIDASMTLPEHESDCNNDNDAMNMYLTKRYSEYSVICGIIA